MKVELTKEELDLLKRQVKGKFNHWSATIEEKELMMGVIDKADKLMEELDAYDELDGDLMAWYLAKYENQG